MLLDDWTVTKFLPVFFEIWDNATSFVQRRTFLYSVKHLIMAVSDKNKTATQILPRIVAACTNHVPNVRIVAVETLTAIVPVIDPR